MKRLFVLLSLLCAVIVLKGQTQPYGQIDIADLKLTACDFEKGANAMVLFDKTEITTQDEITIITRHKRVKILNEKGLNNGNVTIAYYSKSHFEKITELDAQTINLDNGELKFTQVDKSLIFKQAANKVIKTLTINFPNARVGSVIEYSYRTKVDYGGAMPTWDFQGELPVRYSEFNAYIQKGFKYRIFPNVYGAYEENIKEAIRNKSNDSVGVHYAWAVKNTPSFKDEPYTTCREDNIQCIRFFPAQSPYVWILLSTTWGFVAELQLNNEKIKEQLNEDLKDDFKILPEVNQLITDDEKIAFIFNKIKNGVKWNGLYNWGTVDGAKKAWEKKQGTSAEINFILYNFLRMAGIKSCMTYASTRSHGKVNPETPGMYGFNTLALTVKISPTKSYILDASNKYNSFNNIPFDLLNCYSLTLDPDKKDFDLETIKDNTPLRKTISVSAQIKPDGKLEGLARILSSGNNKAHNLQQYDELGEIKYEDDLRNNDNNLKINSFKRDNIENDTLPLLEVMTFKLDLTSSDENYIYVNPTLFTSFNRNPFLSENRQGTIDFGNLNSWSIRNVYTTPVGYKIESLPENVSMSMPDKSISFKRTVAHEDATISIHYSIEFKRSEFTADEYPPIRDFYKKMYEMLNEQIVLKKL